MRYVILALAIYGYNQGGVDHFPQSQIANCNVFWNQPIGDNDTDILATVQSYTYKASVDNVTVQLSATCTGIASPYSCNSPVPSQGQGVGPHTVTVMATDKTGQAGPVSDPYQYVVDAAVGPPGKPTGVVIRSRTAGTTVPLKPEEVNIH